MRRIKYLWYDFGMVYFLGEEWLREKHQGNFEKYDIRRLEHVLNGGNLTHVTSIIKDNDRGELESLGKEFGVYFSSFESKDFINGGRDRARMFVRLRDNFTCQDCGDRRTPIETREHNKEIKGLKGRLKLYDVHHLNGLCGKKTRGSDGVNDISGLITLCHKCHYNRPEHKTKSKEWVIQAGKISKKNWAQRKTLSV